MRGGHAAARSGSRRNVDRRPACRFALRAPHDPNGLIIALFPSETPGQRRGELRASTKLCSMSSIALPFRKKLSAEIDELQADLDQWVSSSNQERPYQGQSCLGRFRSCTSPAPAPVPTQSGSLFPRNGPLQPLFPRPRPTVMSRPQRVQAASHLRRKVNIAARKRLWFGSTSTRTFNCFPGPRCAISVQEQL